MNRSLIGISIAGLLTLSLAGCTPATDASGAACAPAGGASKSLRVSGEIGATDLELASSTPVRATELERSTLEAGDGKALEPDQSVQATVTVFNGEDGKRISSQSARLTNSAGASDWASQVLRCGAQGDRIAAVVPAPDVYGEGRVAAAGVSGLTEKSSLVIVVDVREVVPGLPGLLGKEDLLAAAEGEAQPAVEGMPSVIRDGDGKLTVSVPENLEAPGEAQAAPLIIGDGETIAVGDRVYAHSVGVIWRDGTEFESTWGGEPKEFVTTGVIPGLSDAVVGQTVGSQIVAVVPASAGYGSDALVQMGFEADDTMIFVIDILGAVHPENSARE
ncbi:FKBP-type peptidyl-prolyl cis-trans isomerase [Leucobacter sp. NPDC015123]|uniref:FKBP-type peptidyl-prolyl cis-trans isomerase n=1 Tax=Leucobacter sp. NPDC015123 TaxID=3364129 RepID=UPI0036F45777